MSKAQSIKKFLAGLLMIICALVMMLFPEYGYPMVIAILSITLLLYGIRCLVYYFTMARFTVGGKANLYKGVIFFDLGMFTMTLTDIPNTYIMLYLVAVNLFSGVVGIMGAVDAKRSGSPSWKMKIADGITYILIAVLCVMFGKNPTVVVDIYCIGMVYSGILKIISAFRKTAIIYIQ